MVWLSLKKIVDKLIRQTFLENAFLISESADTGTAYL